MHYRVGTRGSKLAMIQTKLVLDKLRAVAPDDEFEIVEIVTRGDSLQDRPISAARRGAFSSEIEARLLSGEIDFAVHSMKDLPSVTPKGLVLSKAMEREDPRDVLVSSDGKRLTELPEGATIGTGSLRRRRQLALMRPDLRFVDLRGNIETRLRKLFSPKEGEAKMDAIVLAAAGMIRLGLQDKISQYFGVHELIPAANQGNIAIELRETDEDLKAKLDLLGNDRAETIATAEREFLRLIGANCHEPVAAYAELMGGKLVMKCAYGLEEGYFAATMASGPKTAARNITQQLCGFVSVVGAGPGDPELITMKALKMIKEADCIIYDRLIAKELLDYAREECELIYVGKEASNHTLAQHEINKLLVRKAMEHELTIRLKGGDPFVFGRGGEECLYLQERGVSFNVIPGISSAIAAPESIGIPVTHRNSASSFRVIAGHRQAEGDDTLDYASMLNENETLVFLMGFSRLREICAGLIGAGRRDDTPVAVISEATTSNRKYVIGNLTDIAEKAVTLHAPAVIVVGQCVNLSKILYQTGNEEEASDNDLRQR